MSQSSSSLSRRALLVNVSISQWTGRRLDKTATNTVVKTHHATTSAGSYTKKLLPGAVELEAVATLAGQARKYFYEQTLPWLADGSRMISAQNHLKFAAEFRTIKSRFDSAVDDFVRAYPALQVAAQSRLGDLFKADEYPAVDSIKSKFSIDVMYLPLPDVKDFRVDVSEAEKRDFETKLHEVESAAIRDVWKRLHEVTKRAAERLAQPDAVFRDSLLSNVSEICALLPALNINDDADLERARREVEDLISRTHADTLRENSSERDKASRRLAEISDRMGAFMGGTK